jgi:hypothetical protein
MTARTVTWRARDATPRPERAAAATKAQRAFRQAGAGACAAAGADRAARRAAAAGRQVAAELASALIRRAERRQTGPPISSDLAVCAVAFGRASPLQTRIETRLA